MSLHSLFFTSRLSIFHVILQVCFSEPLKNNKHYMGAFFYVLLPVRSYLNQNCASLSGRPT